MTGLGDRLYESGRDPDEFKRALMFNLWRGGEAKRFRLSESQPLSQALLPWLQYQLGPHPFKYTPGYLVTHANEMDVGGIDLSRETCIDYGVPPQGRRFAKYISVGDGGSCYEWDESWETDNALLWESSQKVDRRDLSAYLGEISAAAGQPLSSATLTAHVRDRFQKRVSGIELPKRFSWEKCDFSRARSVAKYTNGMVIETDYLSPSVLERLFSPTSRVRRDPWRPQPANHGHMAAKIVSGWGAQLFRLSKGKNTDDDILSEWKECPADKRHWEQIEKGNRMTPNAGMTPLSDRQILEGQRPHWLYDKEEKRTRKLADIIGQNGGDVLPEYTAISYTWGRWRHQEQWSLSGVDWKVPRCHKFTIDELLDFIRVGTLTRFVWIDALCIPTNDDAAKQREIGKQAGIFNRAKAVVTWLWTLDDAKPLQALGAGLLQTLRWHNSFGVKGTVKSGFKDLGALGDFFERHKPAAVLEDGWFSSLWTLQEMILHPNMIFATRRGTWAVHRELGPLRPVLVAQLTVLILTCLQGREFILANTFPSYSVGGEDWFMSGSGIMMKHMECVCGEAQALIDKLTLQIHIQLASQVDRLSIVTAAIQRKATGRRSQAIASALGYQGEAMFEPDSKFIPGGLSVGLMQWIVSKDGGLLFLGGLDEVNDRNDDMTWIVPQHRRLGLLTGRRDGTIDTGRFISMLPTMPSPFSVDWSLGVLTSIWRSAEAIIMEDATVSVPSGVLRQLIIPERAVGIRFQLVVCYPDKTAAKLSERGAQELVAILQRRYRGCNVLLAATYEFRLKQQPKDGSIPGIILVNPIREAFERSPPPKTVRSAAPNAWFKVGVFATLDLLETQEWSTPDGSGIVIC